MTARLRSLEARKQALIGECQAQRELFADAWRGFQKPVATANRALAKLRSPLLWTAVGLIALKLPTRKLLKLPILLWKGWRMFSRVRAYIR